MNWGPGGQWGSSRHSDADGLGCWSEPGPSSKTGQPPTAGERRGGGVCERLKHNMKKHIQQ